MGHWIPAYWFAAYSYGKIPMTLALIPQPDQESNFVDDSVPAVFTPIAGFGALGFGQPGKNPACPDSNAAGARPEGR